MYSHTFNIQLYTDYTYWFARSHACTIISLIKNLYHHIFLIWFLRDIQASNDSLAWCPNSRDRQKASDRQQLCACTLNACVQNPDIKRSHHLTRTSPICFFFFFFILFIYWKIYDTKYKTIGLRMLFGLARHAFTWNRKNINNYTVYYSICSLFTTQSTNGSWYRLLLSYAFPVYC